MSSIDKLIRECMCAFCGCLIENEKTEGVRMYLSVKDYACDLCRLEYQDAFND